MTEPTNQKRKIWPVLSLLVLIVLAGVGYYLDPEGEIVQEVTGIRLSDLSSAWREGSTASPAGEQVGKEPEEVAPQVVESKKADVVKPQDVKEVEEETPVQATTKEEEEVKQQEVKTPSADKKEPRVEKVVQDTVLEPTTTTTTTTTTEETVQVPVQQQDEPKEREYNHGDLRAAVRDKDTDKIVAILKQRPDLAQIKDANGWTILHEAARSGLTESIRALVEQGAVDVMDKAGKKGDLLPLDIALRHLKSDKHPTVVYLKSVTEKVMKKTSKVRNASQDDDQVIKTDDGKVLGPSSLLEAARKNDFPTMTMIVKERPHWVDRKDANGWSVLHEMARAGRLDAVKFLVIEGKANVNARTSPKSTGGSVLFHAVSRLGSDHPVVRYLNSVGAKHIAPGEKDEL